MPQEKRYDMTNVERADEEALADFKRYVGAKPWKTVVEAVKCRETSLKDLSFQIEMFIGVSGLPVDALFRKHRLEDWLKWCEEMKVHVDERGHPVKSLSHLDIDELAKTLQQVGLPVVLLGFDG